MTRISRNEVMKNYWIAFLKTIWMMLWAIGITWLISKFWDGFNEESFMFNVSFVMLCIISVSHYAKD